MVVSFIFFSFLDVSPSFSILSWIVRTVAQMFFCFSLIGCTLLFYETYGKNCTDQSSAPRCALFAEDSIVQSVPEHPKKENVFCLSNSFGDVYLFQVLPSFLNGGLRQGLVYYEDRKEQNEEAQLSSAVEEKRSWALGWGLSKLELGLCSLSGDTGPGHIQ